MEDILWLSIDSLYLTFLLRMPHFIHFVFWEFYLCSPQCSTICYSPCAIFFVRTMWIMSNHLSFPTWTLLPCSFQELVLFSFWAERVSRLSKMGLKCQISRTTSARHFSYETRHDSIFYFLSFFLKSSFKGIPKLLAPLLSSSDISVLFSPDTISWSSKVQ